jgi:hypothetical protein
VGLKYLLVEADDPGLLLFCARGELEPSLNYYRKARVYVPDNQKLARRITGKCSV